MDIVHDAGDSLSPMVDVGQIEGGYVQGVGWLTLEDLRWDESDGPQRGRLLTQSASTYKLPSFSEMPEEFNVHLMEHAEEEGAVYGSKAVGEPPLMLAFSAREALRDAVAAFGPADHSVILASPATPEAVFWAIGSPARQPAPIADVTGTAGSRPPREAVGAGVDWLDAVMQLRGAERNGASSPRWHRCAAIHPRDAGAKMVVSAQEIWGTIGGGNFEASVIDRARELIARRAPAPRNS